MIWYILPPVVTFIVGYFVGANNPLSSVKAKIIKTAQDALNSTAKKP